MAKRKYEMTREAKDQRIVAAQKSAIVRKTAIQNMMAEKLETMVNSMTESEIADASFKDRATGVGIFYDKLYRDNHALPQTAVQINIQTVGQDPKTVEPLMIDVTPKIDTDVSKS
jgi:hypothetical protein